MQEFLREACGCNVSRATISRQLKKVTKEDRQLGRVKRLKARAKMAAEGRKFDFTTAHSRSTSASLPPDSGVAESQEQQEGPQQPEQELVHLQQQQNQPQKLPPGQKELPQLPQITQQQQQWQQQPQQEARFEPFQGQPLDFPTPEQALLSLSRTQPQGPPPPPLAESNRAESSRAEGSRALAQTQPGAGDAYEDYHRSLRLARLRTETGMELNGNEQKDD